MLARHGYAYAALQLAYLFLQPANINIIASARKKEKLHCQASQREPLGLEAAQGCCPKTTAQWELTSPSDLWGVSPRLLFILSAAKPF